MAAEHDPPTIADAPEARAKRQAGEVLEPDRCERQKRHHQPISDQGGAPVGAKARVLPSRADQTEPGFDQALARDDPIKARLG